MKRKKRKQQEERLNKMLKNIDEELDELYFKMIENDPGDEDSNESYKRYTHRMQELIKIRGDLIHQNRQQEVWTIENKLKAVQIGVDMCKIGASVKLTEMVRNSEMNNERITFVSKAYKYTPRIKW